MVGRDALKVVLNFFLGARGRRCVSGNLMSAFWYTRETGTNTKRKRSEREFGKKGRHACVSEDTKTDETDKIMPHARGIPIFQH